MTEGANPSVNQISTLFSKQLKVADEKIKTANMMEAFDWKNIKRAPQMLRQRVKLESQTVDEEFDEMYDNLLFIEKSIRGMSKYTGQYCETVLKVLSVSSDIGASVKELFDPYNSLPLSTREKLADPAAVDGEAVFLSKSKQSIFQEEYELWTNCHSYLDCIQDIRPSIENELQTLQKLVECKAEEVMRLITAIKKNAKKRNYALMDYDKTFINHENLLLKQRTGELSTKQAQQIYNFERKLEEYRVVYNYSNDLMKRELPIFFRLVDSFLQPLQLRIYYVQLLASYQINNNLNSIQELFNVNADVLKDDHFSQMIVTEFEQKHKIANDMVNLLSIINFRDNFFGGTSLASSHTESSTYDREKWSTPERYCQAQFSFKGQQEGDLSFKTGAIIKVYDTDGGWWRGEIDGKQGIFPGNYVKLTE